MTKNRQPAEMGILEVAIDELGEFHHDASQMLFQLTIGDARGNRQSLVR